MSFYDEFFNPIGFTIILTFAIYSTLFLDLNKKKRVSIPYPLIIVAMALIFAFLWTFGFLNGWLLSLVMNFLNGNVPYQTNFDSSFKMIAQLTITLVFAVFRGNKRPLFYISNKVLPEKFSHIISNSFIVFLTTLPFIGFSFIFYPSYAPYLTFMLFVFISALFVNFFILAGFGFIHKSFDGISVWIQIFYDKSNHDIRALLSKKREFLLVLAVSAFLPFLMFPEVKSYDSVTGQIQFETYMEPNTTIQEPITKSYTITTKLIKWYPLAMPELSNRGLVEDSGFPRCNVEFNSPLKCDIKDNYLLLFANDSFSIPSNFSVFIYKNKHQSNDLTFNRVITNDEISIQVNNTYNTSAKTINLFLAENKCEIVKQIVVCGNSTETFNGIAERSYSIRTSFETPTSIETGYCQYSITSDSTKRLDWLIVPRNTNFKLIAKMTC